MQKTIPVIVRATLWPKFKYKAVFLPLIPLLLLFSGITSAQESSHLISGTVTTITGKPIPGATVKIKVNGAGAITDKEGYFSIKTNLTSGVLIFSFVSYKAVQATFNQSNHNNLKIILQEDEASLQEINVVSTGYQTLPKERATGSFAKPNKEMFEARVSSGVISRLEGITSGLVFNAGPDGPQEGKPDINIRGRSTIYANDQPLIVVDNFPYNGNINDLNPQDIETIDILKDAAAASIWGVKAGNGVIVVTTKKGKLNQATKISVSTNVTVGEKPDLHYDPNFLSSAGYIDVQQLLFNAGKYDADLADKTNFPAIPAAVEIMDRKRSGLISDQDALGQMDHLKSIDIRDGLLKYYYVNPVNQQYAINLSSGTQRNSYYFSAGYDKIQTNQRSVNNDRITLNFSNTYVPVKNLEITTQLNYVLGNSNSSDPLSLVNATTVSNLYYPYVAFADENGTPVPVNRGHNNAYINGAVENKFLDWSYNPLAEFGSVNNNTKTVDARIFAGVKYSISKEFSIEAKYQHQQYNTEQSNTGGLESYDTRNLINQYSILSDGKVSGYNIPKGDILSLNNMHEGSNNLRGQLSYNHHAGKHAISAIAGAEVIESTTSSNSDRLYGYDAETGKITSVNYTSFFLLNPSTGGYIPNGEDISSGIDRFRSLFANASYTYNNRYTISASARKDGSNYFGVSTNQKTVPLWSAGIKWDLTQEKFFPANWPSLQFRATYGYNGNLNKSVTGVTTFLYQNNATWTNLPYARISNLGNPELRWEKSGILNLGIDFNTKDSRLSGSVEYFLKNGVDIIGDQLLAPSVGYITGGENVLRGNFAGMKGNGFDLQLSSKNLRGRIGWVTSLNFSYATDKVTKYDQLTTTQYGSFPPSSGNILPYVGKPVYALYSYKWAGLDPQTGDPRGFVNGAVSSDYDALLNPTSINDLVYEGSSRPKYFGGIGNQFTYKRFSLIFNISYKLGYFFRRSTIGYNTLLGGGGGHQDYNLRWQKPGDEQHTTVPSLVYPASLQRDNFYQYSEATVEKGDHIRFQDFNISYDIITSNRSTGFQIHRLKVFAYANNIGILWKANKKGLDPDFFTGGIPYARTIAIGLKADL